ncbi:Polyadenylate-binding protein RBP45B [Acorus calamus]|uniref:Polyadenylate-binding protein RBP45B n=1 Tax=Acorus calamus TaxID=4465 RepID=A0AAV9E6W9_ACOCL|nr:Polyadenylate-binding protein RBP45B [Acorus calamus]
MAKTNGRKRRRLSNPHPPPSDSSSSDTDSALESDPDRLQTLLDPYTKDRLVSLLSEAAASSPSLLSHIRSLADRGISHRKIFVRGLSPDSTSDDLVGTFSPYGDLEDCNVVLDRPSGKCKGYGFVLFRRRSAALKALKHPEKKIRGRPAYCQLASLGPSSSERSGDQHHHADVAGRKIYVSNVHQDVDRGRLRSFFERFGEIETGPLGFDTTTGKSRGFALFVYRTQEGAKKAMEEPYRMFEGHQLHVRKAADPKGKAPAQPVLAAAAQNMGIFGQNPLYGAMMAAAPGMGLMGPSPYSLGYPGLGIGGYVGSVGGDSLLGAYGGQMGLLQALPQNYGSGYARRDSASPSAGSHGKLPSSYIW